MWYILYPCGWKIISSYPLMLDILYRCGWKIIPSSSTYVRYFVPLWLENHTFNNHLCEIFCTLVVGKSYLRQPLMLDILYPGGYKIIPLSSTYVRDIVPLQLENHTWVNTFMMGNIVLSEYEFQSHSPPNHQLIILEVTVPIYWISYQIGTLSYVYDSSIWNEFHQIKEWKSVQDYSQSSGKRGKMPLVNYN